MIAFKYKNEQLCFFDVFGFQLHGAKAINFAIDVVIAFDQADVFDFCPDFDDRRSAFDFEIFDQSHGVAVLQNLAVGVFPNACFNLCSWGF